MRRLIVLLFCLAAASAGAVPLTFLVTPPVGTPPGAAVHLAGDFQGWQPGDPAWQLQPTGDGRYALTVDFAPRQGLQFKFTRGSWLGVEKGPQGEEVANRLHVVVAPDTLHLQVAGWADGRPVERPATLSGDVRTFSVPNFLGGRRVWIYLPPGYDAEAERRYPVLYMFDGQNVFNDATSFVGEWRVDEALEAGIAAGRVAPLIVVAVDNGQGGRLREYTPWVIPARPGSGSGPAHLQAWVDVLLPHINETYRTLDGPAHTGLAGSSLGGLMTLYGGFAHPEVFGRLGAFSPSLIIGGKPLADLCAGTGGRPQTVYLDMGGREAGNLADANGDGVDDYLAALRDMAGLLHGRGYVGGWDLLVVEDSLAQHNEEAWARRFPQAVEFLFPAD